MLKNSSLSNNFCSSNYSNVTKLWLNNLKEHLLICKSHL